MSIAVCINYKMLLSVVIIIDFSKKTVVGIIYLKYAGTIVVAFSLRPFGLTKATAMCLFVYCPRV